MNFLKKGPELKLPELKVPDFLVDLFHDLRDRHLLPLVALLVIAIVAVPIAMGGSSDSEEEPTFATPSAAPPHSSLVVAKAAPGLRDYRKRLDGHSPKDPFEQQYAGGAGGEGSETTESESASGTESSESSETSGGGSEPVPAPGKLTYFSFAIDVRVVSEGPQAGASTSSGEEALSSETGATASAKGKATVRRNLPQLTMLPSREAPAAIFMGVTKDRKKALLMVSSDVTAIFGDGICVLGSQTCQMVAVEPGLPETFVYGPQQRTFKIEVLKIRLVTTDHLNRAPLGKPKKNSDG
jgi:hypothetical protein